MVCDSAAQPMRAIIGPSYYLIVVLSLGRMCSGRAAIA